MRSVVRRRYILGAKTFHRMSAFTTPAPVAEKAMGHLISYFVFHGPIEPTRHCYASSPTTFRLATMMLVCSSKSLRFTFDSSMNR